MRSIKTAVLTTLFIAAAMTGCTGKKAGTDNKADTADFIKDYKTNLFTQMDFVFDTDKSVSVFGTDISTGNVTVAYSGDSKTGLSLEYTVYADTDEVCQEVKGHLNATAEVNGSRMDIKLIEDKTGEDIDEWLRKNIPDCRVEYDLYITVPRSVSSFDVKENTGNLNFRELSGSFSGNVEVGNITCTDLEFTGASVIKCDTGNITLTDCIYKADVDISSDTGNISLSLPLTGSGDAKINASADTGNIEVSAGGKYEVISDNEKDTSHSMTIDAEGCTVALSTECGKISI